MRRPFHVYAMSLVERLGFKTLSKLYEELTNDQIMEWAAYDMIKDPEIEKRLRNEINLENQKGQSLEEEARKIKALFMGM